MASKLNGSASVCQAEDSGFNSRRGRKAKEMRNRALLVWADNVKTPEVAAQTALVWSIRISVSMPVSQTGRRGSTPLWTTELGNL